MEDNNVLTRISKLVDEEHHLLDQRSKGEIGPEGHERLHSLEVELDQCWDFLRQRRAARDAGRDASSVAVRDANTVEQYQQ